MKPTQKIAYSALLTAAALMLSYIESLFPLPTASFGLKLGLANIAVMASCFYLGFGYAVGVSISRILIGFLLLGSVTSLWFSLCGGVFALLGLAFYLRFLKKTTAMTGVSVLCAALHSTGQCLACSAMFGFYVMLTYLPYLLLFSVVTGALTGFIVWRMLKIKIYQG